MIELLRHRNFAPLWWGGLISLTGNRVLTVALPFYVFVQTGSTIATAGMVIATIVPTMLFGSVAGVWVDRWNRKRILVISNVLMALVLLPLLLVGSSGWWWLVYPVAFLETTVSTFFRTAENALLPQLVGGVQLIPANALNALNDTLARLVGPALGGTLLAAGSLDTVIVFDSLSYAVAGLLAVRIEAPPHQARPPAPGFGAAPSPGARFLREWRQGFTLILRHRVLLPLTVVMGLTTLGGTMIDPLFAPFVFEILTGNAAQFGWILTVQGLGGIGAGLLVGRLARRLRAAPLLGLSSAAIGILLLVMFRSNSVTFVTAVSFVLGAVSVGSRVGSQTLLQEHTSDANRGRVYGTGAMIGSSLELLSVAFAGVAAARLGIVPVLSLAAGITFLAGILAILLLARTRSTERADRR